MPEELRKIVKDIQTLTRWMEERSQVEVPRVYHNKPCLNCGKLKKEMVALGNMIFCEEDYMTIFGNDEVDKNSKIFQYWNEQNKTEMAKLG
jgi:hypothetical protein